jgi:hypothetical protein
MTPASAACCAHLGSDVEIDLALRRRAIER